MESLASIATFLGWCTIINIIVILMFVVVWSATHDFFSNIFAKMFGISPDEVKVAVFRIFMQYRLALAVLNVVPYIAVKIMQ